MSSSYFLPFIFTLIVRFDSFHSECTVTEADSVSYQALKSLSHNGCKASLSRQLRDKKQVFWSTHLIWTMRPTCYYRNKSLPIWLHKVSPVKDDCDTNLVTCVILLPSRSISYLHLLLYLQRFYAGINLTVMTYQTVVWLCLHSKAVQGLCEHVYVDSVTKQNQQCCHDFQSLTMEHEYFSRDNFSSKITRPKLFKLHVTFCRKTF